jgi:hypothetical protein
MRWETELTYEVPGVIRVLGGQPKALADHVHKFVERARGHGRVARPRAWGQRRRRRQRHDATKAGGCGSRRAITAPSRSWTLASCTVAATIRPVVSVRMWRRSLSPHRAATIEEASPLPPGVTAITKSGTAVTISGEFTFCKRTAVRICAGRVRTRHSGSTTTLRISSGSTTATPAAIRDSATVRSRTGRRPGSMSCSGMLRKSSRRISWNRTDSASFGPGRTLLD